LCLSFFAAWGLYDAGRFLVLNRPQHADFIVVLAGDRGDNRFQHALQLLREGYAHDLILDAPDWIKYGRSDYDYASEYVQKAAPDQAGHVHVCSFTGDSTQLELTEIASCLRAIDPKAQSAVLVSSNYHTRRALSVAQHVLPQYNWSVGAAPDPDFEIAWWKKREYAKVMITEWQKYIWWTLIEKRKVH
jgi:hypothetical protein